MQAIRTLLALTVTLLLASTAFGQAVKNPDTLVIVSIGAPETMDPAYGYDTISSQVYLWHIYETLIFLDGSLTGSFVPMLASEVPSVANGGISRDGKTYTFRIREGVRFHDATPLTADDVRYSLLRFMFMDRDAGPSVLLLTAILDAQKTRDDTGTVNVALFSEAARAIRVKNNTISITLKKPFAPFMSIMALWSMVVSKKWTMARGDWDGTAGGLSKLNNPKRPEDTVLFTNANGTGPFRLAQWDRQSRQVILERNDGYWRKPPALKRIVIRTVEDFGARRLMLQQGDGDLITVSRPEQTQVENLAGVRIADNLPTLITDGIFMNAKIDIAGNPDVGSGRLDGTGIPSDFFADINVRRGIAQAFDYDTMIRDCWRGKAAVGTGPIPKGLFGYPSAAKWYAYDPRLAAAALRVAWGGQVWSMGFRFSVLFDAGNPTRQCIPSVLKSGVETLNPRFRIDMKSITWAQFNQRYRDGKLPVFIVGWVADFPDPDNFVTPFMHSSGVYAKAEGYRNPEADRLVGQARFETDPVRREAMYARLHEIAFNDVNAPYRIPQTSRSCGRGCGAGTQTPRSLGLTCIRSRSGNKVYGSQRRCHRGQYVFMPWLPCKACGVERGQV